MESYSQNSNKLDFQHEARILNGIWLITALGLVATAGLAWGAKYLEITATKYDSPQMYVAIGLLLLSMYGLSICHYRRGQHCGIDVFNQYAGRSIV